LNIFIEYIFVLNIYSLKYTIESNRKNYIFISTLRQKLRIEKPVSINLQRELKRYLNMINDLKLRKENN